MLPVLFALHTSIYDIIQGQIARYLPKINKGTKVSGRMEVKLQTTQAASCPNSATSLASLSLDSVVVKALTFVCKNGDHASVGQRVFFRREGVSTPSPTLQTYS